jgi:hypothetical protein
VDIDAPVDVDPPLIVVSFADPAQAGVETVTSSNPPITAAANLVETIMFLPPSYASVRSPKGHGWAGTFAWQA